MVGRLPRRYLLPLALLALVPVVLVPVGGAKPPAAGGTYEICVQNVSTSQPACGTNTGSSFAGNTPGQQVRVTIFNDSTSLGSIGAANIDLPQQLRIDTGAGAVAPSRNVSANGTSQIQVRGVNIQPGRSFALTFYADSSCSGTGDWTPAATSGTDFSGTTFTPGTSTGTPTTLTVGCHLGFASQPTATESGSPITDQAASTGNPVKIGLFDNSNNTMASCPTGYAGCSVTVAQSPAIGTQGGTWSTIALTTGVASFNGSLSVANTLLPASVQLVATGDSGLATSTTSNTFDIALYAAHCNPGCSLLQKQLFGVGGDADSFANLSGASGFTFMTLSPYSLTGVPAGCMNRKDLGVAGFAETDGRAPGGTMTIRYFVSMNAIKARYGKNVGSQFIPICAGGKPIINGVAQDCVGLEGVGGSTYGWVGDSLTNQQFDGGSSHQAVCAADGFYWGILGSFQDTIPANNPFVSAWGSQTIGGVTYRYFDITVPANWDWRSGP